MWKCLNTLWNKKTRRRCFNSGRFILAFSLSIVFVCIAPDVLLTAKKIVPVEMIVQGEHEFYLRDFCVKVKVEFRETNYYNDKLYISYHLVDPKTGDTIRYENPRVKVPLLSEDNSVEAEIQLSLEDFDEYQEMKAQIDIVDETNEFWFSNAIEDFQMPEVLYKDNIWKGTVEGIKNEVKDAPIIFGINVFVTCICVMGIIFHKTERTGTPRNTGRG